MGKIKLTILCLLLLAGLAALFWLNAESTPDLRSFRSAYTQHQKDLKKSPRDARLLYNEAWFLAQQKQYKEALTPLNQALKTAPQNAKYLYTRAWILQQLHQPDQAAQDLKQAKALNWQPATLSEQLRLHRLTQTPKEGLAKVQREMAKTLNPPAGLLYWRSIFYDELQQPQQALEDIEQLLKATDMPETLARELQFKKAELYAQQHLYKQAVSALNQLIQTTQADPDTPENWKHQLFNWQRYSDPAANIKALEVALKASPQDKTLHYLRMDSLLENGDFEQARTRLIEAREAAPEDPVLWCLQSRYQWHQKQWDAAKISLQEAQRSPATAGSSLCIAREKLRQLSQPDTLSQAINYWQQHPQWQQDLYPAFMHQDFKILRKSLESLS